MMPQVNIGQAIEGFGQALVQREQRQEKERQLEEARAAQIQYQNDLKDTLSNPTAEKFAALAVKYPTQREAFKQGWETLSKEQQNQEFLIGTQAFNALDSGNVDVAKNLLDQRIDAIKNTGRDVTRLEAMRGALDSNPDIVKNQLGLILSSLDPDRWQKTAVAASAMTSERAKSSEALSKAKKAAVDAEFAESQAVRDLELKQAQIDNYAADQEIARENLKINKLNADLKKEDNNLKRQELQQKIDEAKVARDEKLVKKVTDANTAFANFDNFLNTADRALQGWNVGKDGKIDVKKPKGYVQSATGPLSTRLPTISQDVADFEETVETLKSQAFLSQVEKMKGLGSLTEREGAALTAALTNLSLRQSPEQLGRNLQEAQRLILKARNETERKFGVTAAPDRPAGPGGAAPAQVPSAMGQATDRATGATAMPSGFRILGRE